VDEYAWLAAARENPACKLVTRALDSIEFVRSAPVGSILRFAIELTHQGNTSLRYKTTVWCMIPGEREEYQIFSTIVTFVNVDEKGCKIPICKPECTDE
jgi:acyl-CoA hydrolase